MYNYRANMNDLNLCMLCVCVCSSLHVLFVVRVFLLFLSCVYVQLLHLSYCSCRCSHAAKSESVL